MRKIIFILFCFFAVTTFAQQKKSINTRNKKNITKNSANIKCYSCNGSGKHIPCLGTGKCLHHVPAYLDKDCYEELYHTQCNGLEENDFKDCTEGAKNHCMVYCTECDSKIGKCRNRDLLCDNGICITCKGKGTLKK